MLTVRTIQTNPATAAATDPNFANVSLLMHFDGSNNSTTFTDSSNNNYSFTAVGDAKLTTSTSKFGTASLALDGTGDRANSTSGVALGFGTGSFTVEFWVYFTAIPAAQCTLIDAFVAAGFSLYYVGNTVYYSIPKNTLVFSNRQTSLKQVSWTPSLNQWYHVAVTRSGSTIDFWIDGTKLGTSATSSASLANGSAVQIGGGSDGAGWTMTGNIDEVRVTKSVARYTANFTAPTSAFPDS